MQLQYPLTLSFKILALGSQFSMRDARGNMLAYVKQKMFKLKEDVTVFSDESQSQSLYTIQADRILDFSARYSFATPDGASIGAVKREGMQSLWSAHYSILDGENVTMTLREENAWIKVLDGIFSEIPFVGLLAGYVFHPAYQVLGPSGSVLLRMVKQPALFEGKFVVEKLVLLSEADEQRALLSLMMLVLLERSRG